MNYKILLTGGNGFLGSNLIISLIKLGHSVFILKRSNSDLTRLNGYEDFIEMFNLDEMSVADSIEKTRPDIIIHCATDFGRKKSSVFNIIESNLILPIKLLESAQEYNVKCFINTDTYLDKGINQYSLSKKQFKEWLFSFSSNLICVNIILEHFYGPQDDKTKFVSFIVEQFLSNAPEVNLTLGEQKRDFIYINDVVSAFLIIIKKINHLKNGFFEYEIGTNKEIKIRELVLLIKALTKNNKTKVNFGAIPYRENEIMESNVNTKEIFALGWFPKVELKDGLKHMIEVEISSKFI